MISFIIIGKNEGWRLQKCLQSISYVVEQDAIANYEIIYVDSQSTDNSIELAKQYGAKAFLITGECNAAIARNIGAKEAIGDIFVDSTYDSSTKTLDLSFGDEQGSGDAGNVANISVNNFFSLLKTKASVFFK